MLSCNTLDPVSSAIVTGINFTYNDNGMLKSQEEWTTLYGDNVHRTVSYTYDEDSNRQTVTYPGGLTYTSAYTNRNQLASLTGNSNVVSYTYDPNGNMLTLSLIHI